MVGNSELKVRSGRVACVFHTAAAVLLLLVLWVPASAQAALQFDVFLGYDGIVPEASWFPVVCEAKNDGAPFKGTIEVTIGSSFNDEQTRLLPVELPTGTLKRFVIPVFSTARSYSSWTVRLLDDRRHVRAEQVGLRPNKQIASDVPLLGSLARTVAGTPVIRQVPTQNYQPESLQPVAARLQTQLLPDNPLVLEGMRSIYLSSERISQLRIAQVEALLGWLNAGGHLILGVDQLTDINSASWLKPLLPCELTDIHTVQRHPEFQEWLRAMAATSTQAEAYRAKTDPAAAQAVAAAQAAAARAAFNRRYGLRQPAPSATSSNLSAPPSTAARVIINQPLGLPPPSPAPTISALNNPYDEPSDFAFEAAEMQIAGGTVLDGAVLAGTKESPLMVTASRGRGRITLLMFSPEREPFHSGPN